MSIGTTAWLPSTLTCTLQAHYITHDTTPCCPTIPNHLLNGTVTWSKPGFTPCPASSNFVARKVRPNTDLTFRMCAPHNARPPYQFAARQMVASPRRVFY